MYLFFNKDEKKDDDDDDNDDNDNAGLVGVQSSRVESDCIT